MRGVRLLVLAAFAGAAAWGAEVCPPPKALDSEEQSVSYSIQVRPGKYCFANEIRSRPHQTAEVAWREAGIESAVVTGSLRIAQCCFDAVETVGTKVHYASGDIPAKVTRPAEEGLARHEEGYPDLIEEDARVRTVSIRGTLSSGGRDVRVDVQLKCSASQFAKQYAYQYSIVNGSPDPVDVAWDLVERMRRIVKPAQQIIPQGTTFVFLSDKAPAEAAGRVVIHTRSRSLLATFVLDGFAAGEK